MFSRGLVTALILLLAVPALSVPVARAAPTVAPAPSGATSFLDLASEAGREASPLVFQTNADQRRVCRAEADAERQACLAEAGENCEGVYQSALALCDARYPASSSSSGSGDRQLVRKTLIVTGVVLGALLVLRLLSSLGGDDDIY